jgi:hypothetical protein
MKQQFIIPAVLALSLNITAQTTYDSDYNDKPVANSLDLSKISFGLKVSPTVSWIDVVNTDMQSDGATLKIGVGGVVNYEILPNLSFVSGVNYNPFGGYVYDNKSLNDTVFKSNYKVSYSEVEVPVALKLKTTRVNKTSYFLQGGFSVGFVVSASEKRVPVAKGVTPDYVDVSLLTNPTRLTCLFGAGLDYSIGKRSTLFGLISYKKSLTNIANSQAYQSNRYSSDLQMFPGNMEFSIGIMF